MESLSLTVTDVATGGDGIARHDDGRIVFVAGAVPGDLVEATVVKDAKRLLHAVVHRVVEAGPGRVDPSCPHVAAGCGGCGWQHVDLEAQRAAKLRIAQECLRRIGKVPGTVTLAPPLPARHHRTSIRVVLGPDGPGFRAAGSHRIVPVDSCEIAHPALASLLAPDQRHRLGAHGEVTLRVGGATGERLALYDPGVPAGVSLPDDVVVVGLDVVRDGTAGAACFHDVVAGQRFRISAGSFFQTRTDGAEALVAAVRDAAGDALGSGRLADLYGGVGLFSATMGNGMSIVLVESNPSSVDDARHNLAGRDATIVRSRVERWTPEGADVVIADPPRAGLGADGVATVAATGAGRVVLVSCDAAAFGRDAGLLVAAGYSRQTTVLVDLFAQTPHVELVSRFDRTLPIVEPLPS